MALSFRRLQKQGLKAKEKHEFQEFSFYLRRDKVPRPDLAVVGRRERGERVPGVERCTVDEARVQQNALGGQVAPIRIAGPRGGEAGGRG